MIALLTLLPIAFALDVDTFTTGATTGDPTAFTRLGSMVTGDAGTWDAGLVLDYADAPLSEQIAGGRSPVIDVLATTNLTGGYSFGGVRLDGTLPLHLGVDASDSGNSSSWLASGDARVGAQLAVPHLNRFTLGSTLVLPTGADALYVGGPGRLVTVLRGGREFGRVGVLALAGAVLSLPEQVRGLEAGVGPVLGVGAAYRMSDALSAAFELGAEGSWGVGSIPLESTLSARMRLPDGIWASAGAAAGLGAGVGASRWRVIVGVGYSGGRPGGVTPAEADARSDGDADADGDGILDDQDACPGEAETIDGVDDADGCPDPDGDGDAFTVDACPSEPLGPGQDPRHSDGCPQRAELAGDHVAVTGTIFFREGRAELLVSAEPVLTAVRDAMQAHPEVALFLIEGHANTDGPEAYNLRLSDARAFSVMGWLVKHGVDSNRLISKGFGESQPLLPESSSDALAANRRVEFRVVHIEDIPPDSRHIDVPADAR